MERWCKEWDDISIGILKLTQKHLDIISAPLNWFNENALQPILLRVINKDAEGKYSTSSINRDYLMIHLNYTEELMCYRQ